MDWIWKKISINFAIFYLQILALNCDGNLPNSNYGYLLPQNCLLLECPEYVVIHSDMDFEIRKYNHLHWMSFPVNSSQFESAQKEAFYRLFAYINGRNEGNKKIEMTAPVLLDLGFATNSSLYTMYLYLPRKFQENPPQPISREDRLVKLPASKYKYAAIRRFQDHLSNFTIEYQVMKLKTGLNGTNWASAISVAAYSVASYNAPNEAHPVNEILIWFT